MEIQYQIPIPPKHHCKTVQGNKTKYPWAEMQVGESFFIDGYSYRKQSSLIQTAKAWCLRNAPNRTFTTRKTNDGIRVFRVR